MADLGRWLSEDYRVPGGGPEDGALDDEDADAGGRAPGAGRGSDIDD